jgi:hypothetical protein
MRSLAEYVLRGRMQAVWVALLFTLIPLVGWMISVVIVGLVTLRKGALEGFWLVLWTAIPSVALAVWGQPSSLLYTVVYGSVLVWILAIVLRERQSWHAVLQVGAVLGALGVLVVHITQPHIVLWWEVQFNQLFQQIDAARYPIDLAPEQLKMIAETMAKYATGVEAVFIVLSGMCSLIVSRWVQAWLFNPGGFRQEFYRIHFGKVEAGVLLLCVLASIAGVGLASDWVPVIAFPFLLAGVSLIHSVVGVSRRPWFWIIGFYVALIILSPYSLFILLTLAFVDSWLNFRNRLGLPFS